MKKVVAGLFISLDGVVEAPNLWQFDVFDEDMMKGMIEFMGRVDTALLGRVTYQEWAGYWPNSQDEPYASFINNMPKYVFSTTLDKVEWQNSTLVRGNLAQEIAKLKQLPGPKDISTQGSPSLVRSLLQNDLLDELILMIHPVVVGSGKRLFAEGDALKRLKLVDHTVTGSGVVFLTYHRRENEAS